MPPESPTALSPTRPAPPRADVGIVPVELGERSYEVVVGAGILEEIGAYLSGLTPHRRCALVVDEAIRGTHGRTARKALERSGFAVCEVVISANEENKNLRTLETICRTLLDHDVARNTPLVALGGGITGDTAGFAAAAYQRGIPFVQVPTTLLSMVDSSVGGKVAVNLDGSKNMVGAFYQPRLVLIDVQTLSTLDAREMRCGLAECLKHGVIGDPELFRWTRANAGELLGGHDAKLRELITRNVAFKAAFVTRDETEQADRALLNLGHTFGHAIEGCGGSSRYKHGEAIAIGVVAASHFGVSTGMCDADVLREVEGAFGYAGLPTRLEMHVAVSELIAEMRKDKKVKQQDLTLIVPKRIGECTMVHGAPEDAVAQSWKYVMGAP